MSISHSWRQSWPENKCKQTIKQPNFELICWHTNSHTRKKKQNLWKQTKKQKAKNSIFLLQVCTWYKNRCLYLPAPSSPTHPPSKGICFLVRWLCCGCTWIFSSSFFIIVWKCVYEINAPVSIFNVSSPTLSHANQSAKWMSGSLKWETFISTSLLSSFQECTESVTAAAAARRSDCIIVLHTHTHTHQEPSTLKV